jgi:hypothetical protein
MSFSMTSKKEKPWKLCHISEFDFFFTPLAPLLTKANRGAHPCAPPYILSTPVLLTCQTIYLYNHCDITFLTMFVLVDHPVNFPCRRKPVHPEKTHDFRQSVDRLFLHESLARIELGFLTKVKFAIFGGVRKANYSRSQR